VKNLSVPTRIIIWVILAAGALLLGYNGFYHNWQNQWMPAIILSLLGSLTLLFKVEGATSRTHYNITFMIYGFTIILYGASVAVVVVFVAHIVEWVWHKYPWYIQLFNLSSFVIVAACTNLIYELINPTRAFDTWQAALGMLIAMISFTLLNHFMIGLIVWLARGENFSQSGIFSFFSLEMDCVMLSLGAGATVVWAYNPFAIVLLLLPLYLIYSTLRVPALERQSETDQKTGVYNHAYFEKSMNEELRRADRFDRPMTIVMADLDLLRNINNSYGHLAGDEVLIGVARVLKQHAREYDIVARFGGEEFAILMPETTPTQAYPIIELMRKSISKTEFMVPTSVTTIQATMSFGIAGREPGQDGKTIIHNADMALYHAKLKGRNLAFIYTNDGFADLFQPGIDREIPTRPRTEPPAVVK
jgi:diguanylate cyclase (GGDEF)-like protein